MPSVDIPPDITGRGPAIEFLVQELACRGMIPADLVGAAVEAVIIRESWGTTALGGGVAIPHARFTGPESVVLIHGRSAAGLNWPDAPEGGAVHEVYLVLSPVDRPGDHLRALAYVANQVRGR
jgi:PTS system fructose-specific IIA component/PTS system nitrogen regulatory IIA component